MKTKRISLLLFLLGNIIGMYNFVSAQCQLDQSQTFTNAGRSARNIPGAYEGQSFTAGITGNLCKIEMLMFNTMSGTGTLKIYSGSGITGTLLTSQSVFVNVPSGSVWQSWTITTPPAVVAGSVYTFQFIPTQGGGLPDPYGINVSTNDVYAGGVDINNPSGDLAFKVHIDNNCALIADIYSNSSTTFCQGGSATLYATQQGSPYTYQWLLNGNPINGATDSSFIATQSGNYSLLLDSLGCKDTSNVISITVRPLPTVSINNIPPFINFYAYPLILTGNPIGGTFSGSGITGIIFNPNAAGLGSHTISYNYTDNYGCSNSAYATTIIYDTLGAVCTSYDTITTFISVTDTLIINVLLTGITPPNNTNIIRIYPNPASTHIYIDNGNYNTMTGYTIRINNDIGQTVFSQPINQPSFYIELSSWTGYGLYYLLIVDNFGNTIETKKIILQ